jgi:digeranylgeranylglycerophospholipid reductase
VTSDQRGTGPVDASVGTPLSTQHSALSTACDAVIVGGSYAGLAAALALGARALVIDQHDIGAIQRSACGAPLDVVRHYGGDEAVLQVYSEAFVHTPRGVTRFPLSRPYCIFDHAVLCRRMLAASGATFLRGRVQGLDGDTVRTSAGDVRGRALIDASGWPAALATRRRPDLAKPPRLTPGIEADIPLRGRGMHFYVDARVVRAGYAWVFPAGDELRVGVASYRRDDDLKAALGRFLEIRGFTGRPSRGGMIPWYSRPPTVDGIFLVGDSAGQTLPLTAEGIRFAFHFGDLAGRLVASALDGDMTMDEALRRYEQATRLHRLRTAMFRSVQHLAGPSSEIGLHLMARTLGSRPLRQFFLNAYSGLTPQLGPSPLT